MTYQINYLVPIFIGLGGILHCVSMCGGFILTRNKNSRKYNSLIFLLQNFLPYNLGRIFSYTFLGFLFGLLGNKLQNLNLFFKGQNFLAIISGLLFILFGLYILKLIPTLNNSKFKIQNSKFYFILSPFINFFLRQKNPAAKFYLGIFTGFLPCGLTTFMFAQALLSANPLTGAIYLLIFGVITSASFLLLLIIESILQKFNKNFFYYKKTYAFIMIFLGVITLMRGTTQHHHSKIHNQKQPNMLQHHYH